MTIRGIGRLRASSRYDPAAMDWYSRVLTAGGTANATTIAAVSRFAASCRLAGIWTKLNRVNLFCGNQLTAALVPLKVGSGSATETNINFVSGDYTEATGITGNGTNKYLDTGLNPTTAGFSLTSAGLWVYARTTAAGGTSRVNLGANGAASDAFRIGWLNSGSKEGGHVAAVGDASSLSPSSASPAATGLLGITTNGDRSQRFYVRGVYFGSPVTAASGFPNLNLFVFATNAAGTPTAYSNRALSMYAVTTGLSDADALALSDINEAFQDALGRGVQ